MVHPHARLSSLVSEASTTAGLCALFCLCWRRCGAMSSRSKAEPWAQELEAVAGRIAPQFGRAEPRRRALTYLQGLLGSLGAEERLAPRRGSRRLFPSRHAGVPLTRSLGRGCTPR